MGDMADDADAWAESKESLEELRELITGNIHGAVIQMHISHNMPGTTSSSIALMESQYASNRKAPVGSTIACPTCGKHITKTTYHKVFCTNQKTATKTRRDKNNCKDRFWNMTSAKRLERAEEYGEFK